MGVFTPPITPICVVSRRSSYYKEDTPLGCQGVRVSRPTFHVLHIQGVLICGQDLPGKGPTHPPKGHTIDHIDQTN